MKLKAFSVFDVKVDAFMPPFFQPTNGSALRHFADAVNDPQSQLSRHPEDYKLCCVGEFDDATGLITPPADLAVVSLGFGSDYVRPALGNVTPIGRGGTA